MFFTMNHHYSIWQQDWRILTVSCQAHPVYYQIHPPQLFHRLLCAPSPPPQYPYPADAHSTHHTTPINLWHQMKTHPAHPASISPHPARQLIQVRLGSKLKWLQIIQMVDKVKIMWGIIQLWLTWPVFVLHRNCSKLIVLYIRFWIKLNNIRESVDLDAQYMQSYNFTTNAPKAYLSTHVSSLSAFVISKTHIVAQKPCGKQLNAKVCSSKSAIFCIQNKALSLYNTTVHSSMEKMQGWGFVYLSSLLPHPYLVCIPFGMPSLHLLHF